MATRLDATICLGDLPAGRRVCSPDHLSECPAPDKRKRTRRRGGGIVAGVRRVYTASMAEKKRFERDELVFDGILAKVHRVHLAMGDGRLVQRDYIHYPGASVVLPVLADGQIVMIRNWRFAVGESLYELPCGCLEQGEDPTVCAVRELAEETGYGAGRVEKLGGFYTGPGTSDEFIHAYLATELTAGRQTLDRYEEISVEVLADAQVRHHVADGTIRDAKTIATLSLYWLRGIDSHAP